MHYKIMRRLAMLAFVALTASCASAPSADASFDLSKASNPSPKRRVGNLWT